MGKRPFPCLRRSSRRRLKTVPVPASPPPPQSSPPPHHLTDASSSGNNAHGNNNNGSNNGSTAAGMGKKKAGGVARLWMRFDRHGNSQMVEWDKNTILKRVAIPARDLRILGPVFSHSSHILAREKAMVVNLEFIKALVTAEEVLILDPLRQELLPFVDRLRQQLSHKKKSKIQGSGHADSLEDEMSACATTNVPWLPSTETKGLQRALPFEFQVLEIALEVVCTYLDSSVADLEIDSYSALDELARNVSSDNLQYVRSLKSNLTRLLISVQKARDEIEHLLDDNEDMADLYLTRKWIQFQQSETFLEAAASNAVIPAAAPSLHRPSSHRNAPCGSVSLVTDTALDDDDVEDVEMLLEAYFIQLDGIRNRILSVREHIDDTEDYVKIQLNNQRNEFIQLHLILVMGSFAIANANVITGMLSMNIQCTLYGVQGIFGLVIGSYISGCFLLFLLLLGYGRWKKLLG